MIIGGVICMSKKKRLFKVVLLMICVTVFAGVLSGCGSAKQEAAQTNAKSEVTIKVGAAAVSHAEILNFIKPKLKQEGINLEVIVLDDEGQLNPSLETKQIDANYSQHIPYLE
jgi:D-methionine transport system substrate-binding protein